MLHFFLLLICLCVNNAVGMDKKDTLRICNQVIPEGATVIVYNGVPIVDTHGVYDKKIPMQRNDNHIDTHEEQNSIVAKQEGTKKITFENGKMKITLVNKNT